MNAPVRLVSLALPRQWGLGLGLGACAVVLPGLAHALGLPVRWLVPMHWPVLLAGLVCGWRPGLVVGLLAPLTAHLMGGWPQALMLPAMGAELGLYGLIAGLAAPRLGSVRAVALAAAGGRLAFALVVLAGLGPSQAGGSWLAAAFLPGLPAVLAQVATLPWLAGRLGAGRG
jgi:niacin transporter